MFERIHNEYFKSEHWTPFLDLIGDYNWHQHVWQFYWMTATDQSRSVGSARHVAQFLR